MACPDRSVLRALRGAHELPPLLGEVPGLVRVDVIEERLRRHRRQGLCLQNGRVERREQFRAQGLVPGQVPRRPLDEACAKPFEGVLGPPGLHLARILVERGIVRRRVGAHPVGDRLDERGARASPGARHRRGRGGIHRLRVVAVHPDPRKAIGGGLEGQRLAFRLLGDVQGDGPVVVLAEEDGRGLEHAGEVHRGVEVSRGGGPISQAGQHHRVVPLAAGRPGRPHGLGQLRANAGGPAHLVHAARELVGGHLPALGLVTGVAEQLREVGHQRVAAQQHGRVLPEARKEPVRGAQREGAGDARGLLSHARAVEADPALPLQGHHALVHQPALEHGSVHRDELGFREFAGLEGRHGFSGDGAGQGRETSGLEGHRLLDAVKDAGGQGQVVLLQGVGKGRVPAGDALHRRFQGQEAALLDQRRQLRAQAARPRRLVHDEGPACLAHALLDARDVERPERPEIDELAANAQGLGLLGRRHRLVEHGAPGDDGERLPGADHLGAAKLQGVVLLGHLLPMAAVKALGLEEEDGIRLPERGEQQPLGIIRAGGHDDLQARGVDEERLGALGVVEPALHAAAIGGPDDHGRRVLSPRAVAQLGQLVHELVHGGEEEVGELNLRHRLEPVERHADRGAEDAALGQGRVDDPLRAKLLLEAGGGAEDPAQPAHVFPQHDEVRVAPHLQPERIVHRLDEAQEGHRRELKREEERAAPPIYFAAKGQSPLGRPCRSVMDTPRAPGTSPGRSAGRRRSAASARRSPR
ncbi:probable nuclear antigen [Stigmatella aurantiaca DW4/3-1]|uniref:Probable nuclear antigen n=1 Tax=Stigmatella aurantiaca (strain DW4/3-1) TaxID=378806 RepID=Q08N41_STIAD|nr:probable nuclear antigen [Stigmatella aurantiaca DW4/3-1]